MFNMFRNNILIIWIWSIWEFILWRLYKWMFKKNSTCPMKYENFKLIHARPNARKMLNLIKIIMYKLSRM